MQNYGQNWTLTQASEFVQACYDRDALLETLINFGESWLKGRLICLISSNTLQPVLSKGWASWLGEEETTEAFGQLRHKIMPESVLDEVVKKNHHTFGSPEVLGIESFFDHTGVLPPEHLMVLPIKLGNRTKVLFFGEPTFTVKDLQTFSIQATPMVQLAKEIGLQLEEIIKLAKSKQLPPKNERIPEVSAPELSPAEAFNKADPHNLEAYLPISEPIEVENPLAEESEEIEEPTAYTAKTAPVRIQASDFDQYEPEQTADMDEEEKAPSPITLADTQQYKSKPNVRQTIESIGRPVPVSYDPDDVRGTQDESTGVDIMVPIGISDVAVSSKQTLLGGFSAEDLREAMNEYAKENNINRMTLQGFKLKQPLKPNKKGIEAVERLEPHEPIPNAPETSQQINTPVDPNKPKTTNAPDGKTTQRVKVTDVLLSQDIKTVLNTQQMHAIDGDTADRAAAEPKVVEIPIKPESTPSLQTSVTGESQTQEEPQPKKHITLDVLAPPIPKKAELEEASTVEELPTLEFELIDEDDDEMGEIYEEVLSSIATDSESMSTDNAELSPIKTTRNTNASPEREDTVTQDIPQTTTVEADLDEIQLVEIDVEPVLEAQAPPLPTQPKIEFDVEAFMAILKGRDKNLAYEAARQAVNHPPLIERLVKEFPGRLYEDRYQYLPQNMSPIQQHGPLLVALISIGDSVAPYMAPLFNNSSLDIRFYSTYIFSSLHAGPNLPHLYGRLLDRDGQTRQAAFDAIVFNKNHPKLEEHVLTPIRTLISPKADDLTLEIAAQLVGQLHDKQSVQPLIIALNQRKVRTSQIINLALQRITLQQLPAEPIAWHTWWQSAHNEPRTNWILRAMNASSEPIRELVSEELKQYDGLKVQYHAKMPAASRVGAQQQVKQWFEEQGLI